MGLTTPMTAPLDLEALKRVAEASDTARKQAGVATGIYWQSNARREYERTLTENVVLALIARCEAAETEVKTLEMTLPGLRQLIVEGRAAGFAEGVEAAAKVVETKQIEDDHFLDREDRIINELVAECAAEIRALALRDEVAEPAPDPGINWEISQETLDEIAEIERHIYRGPPR